MNSCKGNYQNVLDVIGFLEMSYEFEYVSQYYKKYHYIY